MAITDAYGLTPAQAGILFHVAADPDGDAYVNHLEFEVAGPLDVDAFVAAYGWVIERHAILRSSFHWTEADEPLQVVHDHADWWPSVHDLRELPEQERLARVRALIDARRAEPMDLTIPPLMRLDLLRVTSHRTVGLWTYHHLVLDGWSLATVYGDLLRRYQAGPGYDPAPPRPFRDHVAWLRATLPEAAAGYWSAELTGSVFTHLNVPRPRAEHGYGRRVLTLDTETITALAARARVTPSVVLHAAWALVLARYADTSDVVFGTVVSGRPATMPGIEQMVGMFINTVPVRVRIDRRRHAGDFLRDQLAAQSARDAHGHVPLVEIRRHAGRPAGDELFGTLLAVENFPVGADPVTLDDGVRIRLSQAVEHTHYPLTITVLPGPVTTVEAEYRLDACAGDIVAAMLDSLVHVIAELAAEPDRPIGELAPLSLAQAAAVAAYGEGGPGVCPATDVVDAFGGWAARHPDAPAVVCADGATMSYAELDASSAALAAWLHGQDVGLGDVVAFQLGRTRWLAVAMLGILRAGAAYLPIDIDTPAPRVQVMLAEAGQGFGAIGGPGPSGSGPSGSGPSGSGVSPDDGAPDDRVPGQQSAPLGQHRAVLLLDEALLRSVPTSPVPDGPVPPRTAPAYVIFTSGSTGTPKGVLVSRAALSDHVETIVAAYQMTSEDRMLQIASPAFDLAAEEFFPAWAVGAAVVLAPSRLPDTVADFAAFLTKAGVTIVNMAAAYWHQWVMELHRLPLPPRLRLASIGAEPIWRAETRDWLRQAGPVRLLNAYGVTEATITTTLYEATEPLPDTEMLPIGRPLAGMSVYLLDRCGDPVPPGVIGELYIGGIGVATGYVGRPAATAERFVPQCWPRGALCWPGARSSGAPSPGDTPDPDGPDPDGPEPPMAWNPRSPSPSTAGSSGARWYRTGDLGYWLAGGSLVLTGRADDQVKIRGHRVEPAEVEAVIAGHPQVSAAAVVVRSAGGEPTLVAYLVTAAIDQVRADSEATLASYLRPAAWIKLDALPMLPSGKVDRVALPELEQHGSAGAATTVIAAPATGTQEWVADTWRDVLGVPAPGRSDRFFSLGGHSLTATQVVARARRAFAVDLPLRSLLGNPTLAEFARAIDAARSGQAGARPALSPLDADVQPPLSYTQERLWFLDRLEGGGIGYNITAAWRLDGALDTERLRGSLATVVGRHAALRTSYPDRSGIGEVRQRDRVPVDLPVRRCPDEPAAISAALADEAHHRFDLATGPLFRFRLLQLGPRSHVLVVNVHHIVFDGWSHAILMTELAACYGEGRAELPELAVQYADFAAWQRDWLSGDRLDGLLSYWRRALAGPPPPLELPTTWPRTAPPRYAGGQYQFEVDAQAHAAARVLARDADATLFVVLLAGFAALLHRWTGQDDIVIGAPVAGRLLPETENLIGCFFNTLALRAKITPGVTFRELADAVRETAYAAYDHQEAPFEKVIEAVGVTRALDQQPLAQVMFVFQNVPHRPLRLGGVTATALTMPEPAKLDLILTMGEEDGRLIGLWEYNAALFDTGTIAALNEAMATLLAAAVSDPDRPVRALPVLSDAQRRQASQAAAGPVTERLPATIPALVTTQAARTPRAPAVITHDGVIIDYTTLDARSTRLAAWLRAQGVGRGDTVGLSLEPGADLPVALLGVLKAAAAYVPIDPATPPARVAELCTDAAVRLVVTQARLAASLDALPVPVAALDDAAHVGPVLDGPVLADAAHVGPVLDGPVPPGGEAIPMTPPALPCADDLAYVLFTSGSTGRPKGVAVTHRNVTAYLRWFAEHYQLGPADRALGYVRYSFDLSVPELYAPLITGGALVLADPARRTDPRHLTELACSAGVTVIAATPSVLRLLADDGGLAGCAALRLLVTCGEPLPTDLIRAVAGQTSAQLDNQYGPTETTVAVTVWPTAGQAPATRLAPGWPGAPTEPVAPLGHPIDDCQVYVNDASGQPVLPGAIGELWVGGEQVARGYVGSPGLTADKFRPDPSAHVAGARLYRTGDLARLRADGELEYLGRADRQVKVRGIRVEPGEVEAVLASHPLVRRAAVIAEGGRLVAFAVLARGSDPPEPPAVLVRGDTLLAGGRPRTPDGQESSVGLAQGGEPGQADLLAFLATRLPAHLVPAAVLPVDELPHNPNGKVDHAALARMAVPEPPDAGYLEPSTPTEVEIAAIYAELLGQPRVGTADDFFALGGQSLLAVRAVTQIRQRLGVDVPLRTVFAAPTVAGLAHEVDDLLLLGIDDQTLLALLDKLEAQ